MQASNSQAVGTEQPTESQLTGQFADKPTRSQSSRGLVNWRTTQLANLANSDFFKSRKALYTRPKPKTNFNPIDY